MSRHAPSLAPDCSQCAALCCIGLALDKGPRFGIDKPAGLPCPNLDGHLCKIHQGLVAKGFSGCAAYDCLGAGQRVTQELHGGQSWRDAPSILPQMMADFLDLRSIHAQWELLEAAAKLPLTSDEEAARQELIAAIKAPLSRDTLADIAARLPAEAAKFLASLRRHVRADG